MPENCIFSYYEKFNAPFLQKTWDAPDIDMKRKGKPKYAIYLHIHLANLRNFCTNEMRISPK